jgi:hypothetical protein
MQRLCAGRRRREGKGLLQVKRTVTSKDVRIHAPAPLWRFGRRGFGAVTAGISGITTADRSTGGIAPPRRCCV